MLRQPGTRERSGSAASRAGLPSASETKTHDRGRGPVLLEGEGVGCKDEDDAREVGVVEEGKEGGDGEEGDGEGLPLLVGALDRVALGARRGTFPVRRGAEDRVAEEGEEAGVGEREEGEEESVEEPERRRRADGQGRDEREESCDQG